MKHMLRITDLTYRLPNDFKGNICDAIDELATHYRNIYKDKQIIYGGGSTWEDVVMGSTSLVGELGLSEYETDENFNIVYSKLLKQEEP